MANVISIPFGNHQAFQDMLKHISDEQVHALLINKAHNKEMQWAKQQALKGLLDKGPLSSLCVENMHHYIIHPSHPKKSTLCCWRSCVISLKPFKRAF